MFLPVVLGGFFVLDRTGQHRLSFLWLVAASFVFYGWWNWALVPLLAASVGVNFVLGLILATKRSRTLLVLGIAFNLGLLGWFKYAGFFVDNINAITGTSISLGTMSRALTLFTVFFAWAFFRAEGWDAAMIIIDGLTARAGVIIPDSYAVRLGILAPLLADLGVQFGVEPDAAVYPTRGDLGQVVLVLMIVLAAPNTQQIMAETEPALGCPATEGRPAAALFRWRPNAVTGAFTAAACFGGLALLFRQASNAFIYFQF